MVLLPGCFARVNSGLDTNCLQQVNEMKVKDVGHGGHFGWRKMDTDLRLIAL
jgi:hypothetical protein